MKKYRIPLKLNWFVKLILFILCFFVLSPLFLLIDFGTISINGLEYNLPGFFWLKAIGVSCMLFIGIMAMLIRKQVKYSLAGLGLALVCTTLSNLIHPEIKYTDFLLALSITLIISVLLFRKEYLKWKMEEHV